jgi:hypothetical protein
MSRPVLTDPVARLMALDKIFVEHRRVTELRKLMTFLMAQTEQAIELNREERDFYGQEVSSEAELWILPVIGPSGATKSHSLKNICKTLGASGRAQGHSPILYVKLGGSIRSTKQLQSEILRAFNDKFYKEILTRTYVEADVIESIVAIARDRKTTLVVLDEAHNMLPYNTTEAVRSVATSLKSLVNNGAFSIVMAGTERLRPVCTDGEFGSGMKVPVDFGAASLSNNQSLADFFAFIQDLSEQAFSKGVIDRPFNPLATSDDCGAVFDMTGGVCGLYARFLRMAVEQAWKEERTSIDWSDLISAYHGWRSVQDSPVYDPFRKGPRDSTIKAIRQLVGTP